MAQKQIAPTTTIIKTPIKTEIMAPSLCCRTSFRLHLRLIHASLAKLRWSVGEATSTLGLFFGGRCGIDNLFDRLCGEILSTQPPAGLADGPCWRLDREAKLDQAADGFGAVQLSSFAPRVYPLSDVGRKSDSTDRIDASHFFGTSSRFFVYGN